MYDVIVIGAGAAGLTAAIYTCRKGLKTAIITIDIGGQAISAKHLENYPGFKEGDGQKLMNVFAEQAISFGAEIIKGKVVNLDKEGDDFKVKVAYGEEYTTKAIILTYGKVPRSLGVPGEDKFLGRGVHVCAICDAPMYKNKTVAVVGGGNSALENALYLSNIAKQVYLIHRRDEFRGDEIHVGRIKKKENVKLFLSHIPKEVKGDKFVNSFIIESVKDNKTKELKVEGVFLELGYAIDISFVKHLVKVNEKKEIVVDSKCKTSQEGIFAAGDVSDVPYKQIIVSAGEGAKAGLSAYAYLQGKEITGIDWGHKK